MRVDSYSSIYFLEENKMPNKIMFVFAGTGRTAQSDRDTFEEEQFNENVIRVYFNGCHDKSIGGASNGIGYINPNLDTVAGKIRDSFDDVGQLDLAELKEKFGNAIIIEPQDSIDKKVAVEDISLTGFSRGAVTTFAVARHLNDLGKPIRLFAVDPVPGDSKYDVKKTSSEFYKNHDLRECTNLVEAEVILGAYKNNVNAFHNKFFRQMAPFFSESSKSAIYTVPKTHHSHMSYKAENQQLDFLIHGGVLSENTKRYGEADDRMTFTPKIIQQKHHIGAIGRIEMLPRFKTALFKLVTTHHTELSKDSSIKSAQALYALDLAPQFNHKESMILAVERDTTSKGKALREFIVEFENINQYVFRKTGNEKKQEAMNQFRKAVYEQLYSFPIENATPEQKQTFVNIVLNDLKSIKNELSGSEYGELTTLMSSFLKENIIFHADLTRYLDESETFNDKPTSLKTPEQAMVTISTAKTADEMIEILYRMSETSRACAFDKIPKNVYEVITDANQLGDVLRFLPIKHIEALLKVNEIKTLIKSIDDLNIIMNKSFSASQQTAIFNTMKGDIHAMELNCSALGDLMQHLSSSQCKSLAAKVDFSKIHMNSSKDIISLFEKLNEKQFNKVFPELSKEIKNYLDKRIGQDNGLELKAYLEKRVSEPGAKKVFDNIFPDITPKIESQRNLKQQLAFERKLSQEKEHKSDIEHNADDSFDVSYRSVMLN